MCTCLHVYYVCPTERVTLDMFCRKGMVITIDAKGTPKDIAKKIVEKEGEYVLTLKGNQETLLEDANLYSDNEVVS